MKYNGHKYFSSENITIMTPSKPMKATGNCSPSLVKAALHNERNSLIVMLAEGHRLAKRRSESKKNMRYALLYPPMDTHLRLESILNRERVSKSSLDTTFHTTSYLHNDYLSLPIVDSADSHNNDSDIILFVAKGIFNEKLVNSVKYELYTSIDLSNVATTDDHVYQNINALCLCFNISTHSSHLQTLCLHNCQIDDACVKHVASIVMSNSNMLKSLNLSKNAVTDIGAKTLLDAMKTHDCILQELDLSQNKLTLSGIVSFAENLSALLYLKVLRLADTEHLVPLSDFQKFSASIEKNVSLRTLTLGSEVMDGSKNENDGEHSIEKFQTVHDLLLCFWHGPLYTAITDHIRSMLKQNYSGFGDLLSTNRIDVTAIKDILESVKPEKQLDACFRLIRLRPDILLSVA